MNIPLPPSYLNYMKKNDKPLDINDIPNLTKLTENILKIVQFLTKPEIAKEMKYNRTQIKMKLNNEYADSVPYSIISILCEDNLDANVTRLLDMIEKINCAKQGKFTLDSIAHNITDGLSNEFVYSKFGSKENFEKEILKNIPTPK